MCASSLFGVGCDYDEKKKQAEGAPATPHYYWSIGDREIRVGLADDASTATGRHLIFNITNSQIIDKHRKIFQ